MSYTSIKVEVKKIKLMVSPQIMQKSKNRAIHVYIFNDGSQNDKEIEVLDQSTVQTFKHSGL